jgi:hypothetical protein
VEGGDVVNKQIKTDELTAELRTASKSLDSLKSIRLGILDKAAKLEVEIEHQALTVRMAQSSLRYWVNAPTMTKAQVVKKADKLRVVVQDNSDREEYSVDLCAPKGFAMDDSGEPTKWVRDWPQNMTKEMFWCEVSSYLGIHEQEYNPEYGYEYDETGRMV